MPDNYRYHYDEVIVDGKPLGRHVNHDPASLAYPHVATGRVLVSVHHQRMIPVLDQLALGSCTGNAGTGYLGTKPDYDSIPGQLRVSLDEPYAVQLYSDATKIDPYGGTYPPTDTGSDGLSIAKVLKARGLISGYRHAFTLTDALDALQDAPILIGIPWHTGCDHPDANGLVTIGGNIRGGHELVVDEYDDANHVIGFPNSWGLGYGLAGRAYMRAVDFGSLLADQGDVTVLIPANLPPPTPVDPPFPGATAAATANVTRLALSHGMTTTEYLNWRFR